IVARPVGQAERLWRWCRRNPGIAALTAVVLGLLVTVAVTSSVLLAKVAQEKAQTEGERQAGEEAPDPAQKNGNAPKEAEEEAQKNEQRATEQSRLALDTLVSLVTRVQRQLRTLPGNQRLRQDLLADALAGLRKVVSDDTSSSISSQQARAAAFQHMGD